METLEFFTLVWNALKKSDPSTKLFLVKRLYTNLVQERLTFDHESAVMKCENPSYERILQIVEPHEVPKRKHLNTKEGQAVLLHAIAHIEYSAIDLALDSAYRFRQMPVEYYIDWIEVANDEVRHFTILNELMKKIGVTYGDYPVHSALFDAGKRSGCDVLHRMAVVPRYLEAGGLDANPKIVEKLYSYPRDVFLSEIIDALKLILREEVSHVSKGDRWFKYEALKRGIDEDVYFKIIKEYYPDFEKRKVKLNISARRKAGFSCDELRRMGAKECD